MPIIDQNLVRRVIDVEVENLESRLRSYAERPGNPSGVHVERFGGATAFVSREIPVRFFNSVLGVEPETIDHLDAIERFYRSHGATPVFEIAPGRLTESLGLELGARGFAMVEFHTGLVRELTAEDRRRATTGPAAVEEIDPSDAAAFDLFLDTYLEGWGEAHGDHADAKLSMQGWRSNSCWRFYVARVGGVPAGAAVLDVRGPTAMLASASTRPGLRGHGVQAALLSRRIADAANAGCDLAVGGAYFGTISMRNQQRAGLEIAFTRGVWVSARVSASG